MIENIKDYNLACNLLKFMWNMSKASTKELALIVHIWALKSYLTFYLTTLSMINITTYVIKFKLPHIQNWDAFLEKGQFWNLYSKFITKISNVYTSKCIKNLTRWISKSNIDYM